MKTDVLSLKRKMVEKYKILLIILKSQSDVPENVVEKNSQLENLNVTFVAR